MGDAYACVEEGTVCAIGIQSTGQCEDCPVGYTKAGEFCCQGNGGCALCESTSTICADCEIGYQLYGYECEPVSDVVVGHAENSSLPRMIEKNDAAAKANKTIAEPHMKNVSDE